MLIIIYVYDCVGPNYVLNQALLLLGNWKLILNNIFFTCLAKFPAFFAHDDSDVFDTHHTI